MFLTREKHENVSRENYQPYGNTPKGDQFMIRIKSTQERVHKNGRLE